MSLGKFNGKKVTTHTHIYEARDNAYSEPGFNCTICGFRIPANMIDVAVNAGAKLALPLTGNHPVMIRDGLKK